MKRWPDRLFLDRLALPHMSTNFWMCFCGILFNFQGLRRTFPKSVLELKTTVDHQIWGNTPIGWHKMDGPMGALLQVMIQIDTNRWHWLQIALMVDLQAIDPTADVENSIMQYRICKPQLMPGEIMTKAWWFLQKLERWVFSSLPSNLGQSAYWSFIFGARFLLVHQFCVSPDLMVNRGPEFKNRFRKLPPQFLKIEQNTAKAYSEVSLHVWEG